MYAAPVIIILGSPSDRALLDQSGALSILNEVGIAWQLSYISAHRNADVLDASCRQWVQDGTQVFITAAGLAAALPGAVAAITNQGVPVIAVPLDDYGIDSCLRMPPGVPVLTPGVGKSGLKQAAIAAAQIICSSQPNLRATRLEPVLSGLRKQPEIGVDAFWYQLEPLIEGKTKRICRDPLNPDQVFVVSKDDITAGDGARRDVIENKAELATVTTVNCFGLLSSVGIANHFVDQVDAKTFLARQVEMVPLELVVRRIATGSALKRNPALQEGEVFKDLVFELFYKDDARHDPYVRAVIWDEGVELHLFDPAQPIDGQTALEIIPSPWTGDQLEQMKQLALLAFKSLEQAWENMGITLVDFKVECGIVPLTGEILIADVIDNDSWRIWPGGEKGEMLDKQVYRDLAGVDDPAAVAKELGAIRRNYARVAEMTGSDQFMNW